MEPDTYLKISVGNSWDREIQLITAVVGAVEALYVLDALTQEQALELIRIADYMQARLVADANRALSKT